jgi:hypothetical protein
MAFPSIDFLVLSWQIRSEGVKSTNFSGRDLQDEKWEFFTLIEFAELRVKVGISKYRGWRLLQEEAIEEYFKQN